MFDSSLSRASVISNGFCAVGINFLAICCFICGQANDLLLLHLVLGSLAKAQAQQAKIDLRWLCCSVSQKWSFSCSKWFGLLVRLAKVNVARFCRDLLLFFSASTGRLFVEVGRKQPITMRNVSLMGLSLKGVWLLRHHAGSQYLAKN